MRNLLGLLVVATLAAPAPAHAQASVQLRLDLPVVLPQLVVVQPGVQVVPDVDEEVFLYNGWYWVRRDGGWYRSRSHRHGWYSVRPERVPRKLVGLPPGQYRRWHPERHPGRPVPARWAPAPPPPRPAPAREVYAPPRGGNGNGNGHGGHEHDRKHDHDRGDRW